MNQLTIVQQLESQLPVSSADFEKVCDNNKVTYAQEAGFALQLLTNNSYLGGIAQKNPNSLRAAIINVAAIGTTLNPAEKKAYLVPRQGQVVLDISYRGLADIAVDSGAALWVDSKAVYAGDEYQSAGMGGLPTHKPANPFTGQRGDIVGVYAAAKRPDGTYAVKEMNMAEINAIKARSESGKKNKGPWVTDFLEMALKTPVKNVVKRLQGANKRIDAAIEMLNQQGEGIDFRTEQNSNPRSVNCSQEAKNEIESLLSTIGMSFEQIPLSMITNNQVSEIGELTELEAGQLIAMLKLKVSQMNKEQAQ